MGYALSAIALSANNVLRGTCDRGVRNCFMVQGGVFHAPPDQSAGGRVPRLKLTPWLNKLRSQIPGSSLGAWRGDRRRWRVSLFLGIAKWQPALFVEFFLSSGGGPDPYGSGTER